MTQNKAILDYLEQGHPLTALEALEKFQCLRLASRVDDLKRQGHDILSQKVEHKGKWWAKYFLYREVK